MLRKKALRKIIVTTFSILTIFLICIVPDKLSSNTNYLNPKIDTIYVDNNKTNEIYLLGPNNYLVKTNIFINKDELIDNLAENAIPSEVVKMDVKDYERFLVERRKLMASMIEKYYKSL